MAVTSHVNRNLANVLTLIALNKICQGLSSDDYRQEVENLRRQLELITEEKNELEVSICGVAFSNVQLNNGLSSFVSCYVCALGT